MKQEKLIKTISLIMPVFICLLLLSGSLRAQETSVTETQTNSAAATGEKTGKSQTENSDYVVKSSIEIGVRGRDVNGNENKYRSDLNYKSGVRVFDSSIYVSAKDGTDKAFDTLSITGSGFGADPNGYTRFSVEKIGWYSFDGSVRRFTYFNNLLNLAQNEHIRNTRHNMGDFDITILPQNENIRFRFGFGFDTNKGPGTITYDYDRDEFPIISNWKSRANDIRFGVDGKILGLSLSFTQGYRRFNDDTSYTIDTPQLGNNPSPNSSFATFSRIIPERGRTHYSRFSAHRKFGRWADFTGRFIYVDSKSRFNMIEKITGRDRSGNPIVLDQSDVSGDSKRPNGLGDVGLTIFATDKLTLSNSFSVNSYRITGGNILLQQLMRTNAGGTPLPTVITNSSVYRYTNYRRFINTFQGSYDFNRRFSMYLGYRFTDRKVTLNGLDINLVNQAQTIDTETATNKTNSLLAGFKVQPIAKKWTIFFDLEHGQADNAFTRLGNYDFTQVRVRNRIKPTDEVSLNFSFETKDNSNPALTLTVPVQEFAADVRSRIFSGSISWSPNMDVSINGGYTYNYLNSEIPVYFPVTGAIGQGISRFDLRNNYFYLDGWFRPHPRFSIFGAYRISKDTGGGDQFSAANFFIGGNYPLTFQSPEVRAIFKVSKNIDLNAGYQYYDYKERFSNAQNYRAHLPYASVRFYFGNVDR